MNCVKCGKKTEGTNVFCPECLETMKKYPVKPGTTVHIPTQAERTERKPALPRKERSTEEQLASAQKLVKRLVILSATLATTLAVTLGALVYTLVGDSEPQPQQSPMSRNYTTASPAESE